MTSLRITTALLGAALALNAFSTHAQTGPAPASPPGGLSDCASLPALDARQAALRSTGPLAPESAPSKPELRTELLAMRDSDQQARAAASESARANGGRPEQNLVLQIFATDHENLLRFREIIEQDGFPNAAQVGRDGVAAAFILAQHADSDRDLQTRVLKLAQPLAVKGEIAPQDLAQLTDRVRIGEGKPQVYGSQFYPLGGINHPQPIENAGSVDTRRSKAGLIPLRDYGCIMQQAYGFPVDLKPHEQIVGTR
jgi:hypothetical protein